MPTGTLSNRILDPSGTAQVGVTVTARLMGERGPVSGFRIDTGYEVTSAEQTTSDSSGDWSMTLERNSNISPAGTYWEITEEVPPPGKTTTYACSVSAASQTVASALVSSLPTYVTGTYLTQASADLRYQTLGSPGAGSLAVASTSSAGTSTTAMRSDVVMALDSSIAGAGLDLNSGKLRVRVSGAFTATATIAHAPGYRPFAVSTATPTGVTVQEGDLWHRPDIDALRYSTDGSSWGDVINPLSGWATFTPTLHQPATATLTTATAVGRYVRMGRVIVLHCSIACAQAGTSGQTIEVGSIPSAIAPRVSGINTTDGDADVGSHLYVDQGSAFYNGSCGFRSATNIILFSGGGPTSSLGSNPAIAVANADWLNLTIIYEALA